MGAYPSVAGGGSSVSSGTAAARPAPGLKNGQLYWATDTDEVSYSDGVAWHVIRQTSNASIRVGGTVTYGTDGGNGWQVADSNGNSIGANGARPLAIRASGPVLNNMVAGNEVAAATAGAAGAPPAQVAGYFLAIDSAGNTRKIAYYAN